MPERRFAPGSTALYAVLWLAVVIHGWSPLAAQDSMAWLRSPGDSAARKTSRDLELAEANDRASALERWSLGFLVGSRDEALGEAIDTQRQVLAYLDAQGSRTEATRARLAVLLVEAGESEAGPESPVGLDDWYADALERQRAVAAGDRAGAAFLTDQILERGLRWKRHSQALVAAKLALVVVGLVLATARIRVFRELLRGDPAGPPWSLDDGIGVFVRGEFWNRLYFVTLSWLSSQPFGPALADSPLGSILHGWGTLLASLPLLWLVQRHLLAPHGRFLVETFGLNARLRVALGVGACALAIDLLGTHALAWAAWALGFGSSWAEGFDELLVWGTNLDALATAMDYILWAPGMEELAFRGVLYYSLRHRLTPLAAALTTAGFFAGLHFYSLPGFLMTAWSGLVWALAFERLRSLLPGIGAHAVYNVLYVAGLVLLYR